MHITSRHKIWWDQIFSNYSWSTVNQKLCRWPGKKPAGIKYLYGIFFPNEDASPLYVWLLSYLVKLNNEWIARVIIKLLTSGTNASAGLIRAGTCHSRLFPVPIRRIESWILRPGEIRFISGAQYGTNLAPLHRLRQVASTGMLQTMSRSTRPGPVIPGYRQEEQFATCFPTWGAIAVQLTCQRQEESIVISICLDSTAESIYTHYRALSIAPPVSGHSSEGIDAWWWDGGWFDEHNWLCFCSAHANCLLLMLSQGQRGWLEHWLKQDVLLIRFRILPSIRTCLFLSHYWHCCWVSNPPV